MPTEVLAPRSICRRVALSQHSAKSSHIHHPCRIPSRSPKSTVKQARRNAWTGFPWVAADEWLLRVHQVAIGPDSACDVIVANSKLSALEFLPTATYGYACR
jgi:hypothetical protein